MSTGFNYEKQLCHYPNMDEIMSITGAIYRVIRKSLRDFRPLRYSNRDGHAEEEHVNRGRDTPRFCPTLQVLDSFFLLCLCGCCAAEFGSSEGTYELPCT
jgi:hypothetical protein